MRVLLNTLTAVRQKTGIGHYVTELVHCLRRQHPDQQFATYPGALVKIAASVASRLRQALPGAGSKDSVNGADSGRLRPWLSAQARRLMAWHFRTLWASRSFDLYHEPNYIPLPFDGPTVA